MNKYFTLPKGPKTARALSVGAILAVLVATLWPFNPWPRNGVILPKMGDGLNFENPGIVVSNGSLSLPETSDQESYTVELLLRPASIKFSGTILAFYTAEPAKQLSVMQWWDRLLVTHNPSVSDDTTGVVKFRVDHVFRPEIVISVIISSGRNGTTLYLDGERAKYFPRFEIARRDLNGDMVLGTSPIAYRPWTGEIRGLAVYAKELTPGEALQHYRDWNSLSRFARADLEGAIALYHFTEASGNVIHNEVATKPKPELIVPARFYVPHKLFLESPVHEFTRTRKYSEEVVTNIAGFVPLGLLVFSYFSWTRTRWNAVLTSIAFCGLLSFAIEVLQYYIPKRGSGITDIITNTLGAALGAFLAQSSVVRKPLQQCGVLQSPPMRDCVTSEAERN